MASAPVAPHDAVRAELRAALYDLTDALLGAAEHRHLVEALQHISALLHLAHLDEGRLRRVEQPVREVRNAITKGLPYDRSEVARQIALAADRL